MQTRLGYTLVEVLIVVAIIAALTCGLIFPRLGKLTEKSRMKSDAGIIVDHLQKMRFEAIEKGEQQHIPIHAQKLCEVDVKVLGDPQGIVFYPNGRGTNSKILLTGERYLCIIMVKGDTGRFLYDILRKEENNEL